MTFSVEKQMSIKVEEQEIIRSEKELTATTRLPADADAYQTTVMAEPGFQNDNALVGFYENHHRFNLLIFVRIEKTL